MESLFPLQLVQNCHRAFTGSTGCPQILIDCSARATAFQAGLELVRVAGKYLVIGQLRDHGPQATPNFPYLITRKAIRLNGAISSKPHHIIRTVQMMDRLVKARVEKLITHRFPLNHENEAFKSHEPWEVTVVVIRRNA